MKSVLRIFIAIFLVLSTFLTTPLFGGELGRLGDRFRGEVQEQEQVVENVAGKSFFGNFITSCGKIATSCMSFDRDGQISWDQDFGTGPEVFSGLYREFKQGPNVFWGAVLRDDSPDGVLTLSGLAGANSTFLFLANIDELCTPNGPATTAIGIYQRSDCTPGTRTMDSSEAGGASGSGIGGSP